MGFVSLEDVPDGEQTLRSHYIRRYSRVGSVVVNFDQSYLTKIIKDRRVSLSDMVKCFL